MMQEHAKEATAAYQERIAKATTGLSGDAYIAAAKTVPVDGLPDPEFVWPNLAKWMSASRM